MTHTISADKTNLDIPLIHTFLTTSYWAEGRTLEAVETSIKNALCFGVYSDEAQVGFARIITDYVTFAYLADVFILEAHRGHGLGRRLLQTVLTYPDLQTCNWTLFTEDAHELYARFGFARPAEPEKLMRRKSISLRPLEKTE